MKTNMEKQKTIIKTSEASGAKYYDFKKIEYDMSKVKSFPVPGKFGLERYLPLLPVESMAATLPQGEGSTDLAHLKSLGAHFGMSNLYAKMEDQNPTGCFKDRESAVVMSAAIEKGIKKVNIVSSGNAALSTAAYAQKAGIECVCYVPEKTSHEKIILMELYGATVVKIPGFYEDVYRHVADMNPEGWNVTSGQCEYRTEGDKTIAYEVWEQLGGVPDVFIVPSGNGSSLHGIWKGFKELEGLGLISTLPQMISVQIEGASPIKTALAQNKDFVVLGDIEDSIAEGIVVQESYCSPGAVAALKESGGYVIEVNDQEIVTALKSVIKLESLVPEPTTAAVYAALPKLDLPKSAKVVCLNTGSGMKFLSEISSLVNGK